MPRTIKVESPGCPPIRALTTDELGLLKVVESRDTPTGVPKVVEAWGSPEASRHVLLASMADHESNPILAVARKNGVIELLNPLNGDVFRSDKFAEAFPDVSPNDGSSFAALHLFRKNISESRSNMLLICTEKGKACLRCIGVGEEINGSVKAHALKAWGICCSGNVLCSSVDGLENHALFAGKGVEINLWDLETSAKIWTAKSPRTNSLGIFTPTWFTATTFLCKDDHRKIVAGTNGNQARLYDTSAQRRPVISVDFRDSRIRSIVEDPDGHTIYLGTGKGDLASFDMRTGKLLGCFRGKCSGSIRSIARHPELPVIVSCGLDRYLRLWDTKTRELLAAVFLKQVLTNVVLDSNFSVEENRHKCTPLEDEPAMADNNDIEGLEDLDRCQISSKKAKIVKRKKKAETAMLAELPTGECDDMNNLRPQSPSQGKEQRRKLKHKKRKKIFTRDDGHDCC